MKTKTCKSCKKKFHPEREMQQVCSYECSIEYAKKHLSNKAKEVKTKQRKALKAFNDSDKTVLKQLAQKLFNQFIRLRDKDLPCISCGKHNDGTFDCGHYKPRGGYSALAFNEDNSNGQCKKCNRFLAANLVGYRTGLVKKIGIERVEYLESCINIKRWTIEELKDIIKTYRQKIKEMV